MLPVVPTLASEQRGIPFLHVIGMINDDHFDRRYLHAFAD